MIKITIERGGSQCSSHKKPGRSLPWRRVALGLVAAVVLVVGVVWGISYVSSAPEREYVETIRTSNDAAWNEQHTDEWIVAEIMNNTCDSLAGKSLDTSLVREPEYFTTVSREDYVAISDRYCASRG